MESDTGGIERKGKLAGAAPVPVALWLAATTALVGCAASLERPAGELAQQQSIDLRLAQDIDSYLTNLSGFEYAGATLVSKGGRVVLAKGYGLANVTDRIPVQADTVFDIGSLAKPFTATAIMLLESRGELRLDDPIAKFIDGVPADKQGITIAQLLSHRSGLRSDFPFGEQSIGEYYEMVGKDEAIKRILATDLIGQTGAAKHYSNIGYVLAAAIVERASGRPFRDFIRSELLAPAGMLSSGFWGSDLAAIPDSRLARAYDDTGARTETVNLRKLSGDTWMDLGGGEMFSTVGDLYRWVEALRAGRIIPLAQLDRMWTKQPDGVELGWQVETDRDNHRHISHGGDYLGFGAELAIFPEDGLVIANLANHRRETLTTRHVADWIIPRIALGKPLALFAGEMFDAPPDWRPIAPATLSAAVGTYVLADGGKLNLAARDSGLAIAAQGQSAVDLLAPASPDILGRRQAHGRRALQLVEAAKDGDQAVVAAILREGAPVADYMMVLGMMAAPKEAGPALSIELVGTAPFAYPRGAEISVLHYRYAQSNDYLRLAWDPGQDRIINLGQGAPWLARVPLQLSAAGDGLVGWSVVTTRGLALVPLDGDWAKGLILSRQGETPVTAVRV